MDFVGLLLLIIIIIIVYVAAKYSNGKDTPSVWGNFNEQMICPYCQAKGKIRTKSVRQKKGVSGAKATGALLTLGWSLFFTGLSRKETVTQAHCENCQNTWYF